MLALSFSDIPLFMIGCIIVIIFTYLWEIINKFWWQKYGRKKVEKKLDKRWKEIIEIDEERNEDVST